MALPQAFRSARLTDATLASSIDNEIGNLERAFADIFGATIDENILTPLFSIVAAGLRSLFLQDAAGPPTVQGQLLRWDTRLLYHTGGPFGVMDLGIPTGTIIMWPIATIPAGWLLCDGQAVDRGQYVQLFNILATTFGPGDGSTTFNLPNYKGRVAIGLDPGNPGIDTPGEIIGSGNHTLTLGELPAHTHSVALTNGTHSHVIDYHIGGADTGSGPPIIAGQRAGVDRQIADGAAVLSVSEVSVGGGLPFSLTQPSMAMYFLIKT